MLRCLVTLAATLAVLFSAFTTLSEGAVGGDPVRGKQVYDMFCLPCHGDKGDGKGPVGVTLQPPPRDFTVGKFLYGTTDQDLFDTMTNGAVVKGGSELMGEWKLIIPESDRWAVIAFIRSLKK